MTETMQIRYATRSDAALLRLAALDDRRVPREPVLMALVGDEPRAAISMRDGSSVADPFYPTASLLEALRRRAGEQCERCRGRLSSLWTGARRRMTAARVG